MRIECKYDELMELSKVKERWHPSNETFYPKSQIRKVICKKAGLKTLISRRRKCA